MKLAFMPALLLSAASVPLGAAVDPALLDLTPPNTKILTGVNVDQALQSTFGQFALSKLPQTQGMMQFMAATGFDFRRDLRELLIATDITNQGTKPEINQESDGIHTFWVVWVGSYRLLLLVT